MGVPTNKEMQDFKLELERMGASEAERKLNQNIYTKNTWKHNEIKRFIKNEETKYKNKLVEESNKIASDANKTARWALGISGIAVIVAILVAIFK